MVEKKLNKFEKTRILGARALQISFGAPILVKRPTSLYDTVEITRIEMEKGVLPITIKKSE